MYVITLQDFLEGLQSAIRLAVAVSRLIDCSLDDPATICCELNGCRLFVALQHTLIRKQKLLFQKDAQCFYLFMQWSAPNHPFASLLYQIRLL